MKQINVRTSSERTNNRPFVSLRVTAINVILSAAKNLVVRFTPIISMCLIISVSLLTSTVSRASFEDDASGARMRALGGAFVSFADDAGTVFVQPAGTLNLERPEISMSYGRLFMGLTDGSDISDTIFSAAMPVEKRIGVGFGYKLTGLKQAYTEQTVLFNVSMGIMDKLSAGINLKYLTVKYGSDGYTELDPVFRNGYSKTGGEADAGIFYSPVETVAIGYSIRNLAGTDIGLASKSPASKQSRIGASYREEGYGMILEAVQTDKRYKYCGGFEKSLFADLIKLRLGLGWGDNYYRKVSVGFGVAIDKFTIDYAWDNPLSGIEQTSGTHYLTFGAKFANAAPKEPKKRVPRVRKAKPEEAIRKIDTTKAQDKGPLPISPVLLPGMLMPLALPTSSYMVSTSSETPASEVAVSTMAVQVSTQAAAPEVVTSTRAVPAEPVVVISTKPATIFKTAPEAPKPLEKTAPPAAVKPEKTVNVPIVMPGLGPVNVAVPERSIERTSMKKSEKPVVTAPAARTHRVSKGDSLTSLSERYYGTRDNWNLIYQANKEKIEKGALKPGMIVIIP